MFADGNFITIATLPVSFSTLATDPTDGNYYAGADYCCAYCDLRFSPMFKRRSCFIFSFYTQSPTVGAVQEPSPSSTTGDSGTYESTNCDDCDP